MNTNPLSTFDQQAATPLSYIVYPFALNFLLSVKHFIEEVQKFAPYLGVTGVDVVLSGVVM